MSRNGAVGYMCKTQFDYELAAASDGVKVFPSAKCARHYVPCIHQCGMVKVRVELIEIVQHENWDSLNRLAPASGMEAATAGETEGLDPKDNSPTAEGGDAQ